jgi:hypothetical protein
MKRHSIVSTILRVSFLMLPMIAVSCGSDSGGDLFIGGKPKTDAGDSGGTSATGGASGAGARGGSSGTGVGGSAAQSSGGTAGTNGVSDASAGTSGTGTAGTNGASGASATGGTAGTAGAAGSAGIGGTMGSIGASGSAGTNGTSGTNGSAGSGGVDGSAGTNGASGTAGSSGTNGSAGTGGTAGADAGSDAGDAGPKPCTNSSQCKSDEFCSKPSCAATTGECKARPKTCASAESPVCGCDAVNYWNDCLRQQAGIASGTSGECVTSANCGGLPGFTCPGGRARCAHLYTTELECGISDAFGTCWVIPEQCSQIVAGTTHRSCTNTDRCLTKCEAIKTEQGHFTDSTCPQ